MKNRLEKCIKKITLNNLLPKMNEVLRKCKYKMKKNEVAILQKTLWVASFPQPGLQ